MDWAKVGTFGCAECEAKRRAMIEAMKKWAANPLGAPRPGSPEFNDYVEAESHKQNGSSSQT